MHFRPRLPGFLVALAVAALAAACSPSVDLEHDIELVEVSTGYFDNGLKDGRIHMLPQVAFKIRNTSDHDISSVLMSVSFWTQDDEAYALAAQAAAAEGREPPAEMPMKEISSAQVRGVTDEAIGPGEATPFVVVRPTVGYTLDGGTADFFVHPLFRDVTARVFARRSGAIVQVGEYLIDRRIVTTPQTPDLP